MNNNATDYKHVMTTCGIYSIQDHLMSMKAGYKYDRLSDKLKDQVHELKFNRNADAQRLVYKLLYMIDESDTIHNKEKIDELLEVVNADSVINGTAHTFSEHFERDEEDEV